MELPRHNLSTTIIACLATAIVSLLASSVIHVRDEVSRPEMNAVVNYDTQELSRKVDDLTKSVHEYYMADSVWRDNLLHQRFRITVRQNYE
jgi:hypothetical protein